MTLHKKKNPAVQGGARNIIANTIKTPLAPNSRDDASRQHPKHSSVTVIIRAGTLRRKALEAFAVLGSATALECVRATGKSRWSVQPRISELRGMGMLKPTGARRNNPGGKSAAVLCLTGKGRMAL